MTGAYEQKLEKIANASDWVIPELDSLHSALGSLADAMAHISGSLGWSGDAADAAVQRFLQLRDYFLEIEKVVHGAQQAIVDANAARHHASNAHAQLPSVTVPPDVHAELLTASSIVVPFFGPVAAEFAIDKYEEYLRAQREAKAHSALQTLQSALVEPTAELAAVNPPRYPEPATPEPVQPVEVPDPGWPGSGVSLGGQSLTGGGGGGGTWTGGTGVTQHPNTWVPPTNHGDPAPPTWTGGPIPTHTSVDGKTTGTTSGFDVGSGVGGSGGGLGSGLAGAGVGAGALAAGSKLAGRTPGTLIAGGGLGGGLNGAGGKTNSAMMGGGGGAGGGSEKEKRSSLGLVAPKLDDEDEPTVRSAAAGAGGRDQTPKQ